MGIGGVALGPTSAGGLSQRDGASSEIQKLEQQKRDIQQQIQQLEQSKQDPNAIQKAKGRLQQQLEGIDQQIQVLRQQGAAEVQSAEDPAKSVPARFDQFVKEDSESTGAGIYSMEKDENGNPLVVFDSPQKPVQQSFDREAVPADEKEPETMKCTVNTDKVDAEIKKLKEQEQTLQRQLRQAENREEKTALQKQLANIEAEVQKKDNDAYRKQNATYTYSESP